MWRPAVLGLVLAGCLRPQEHRCADDGECGIGVCVIATGFCAFADDTCCVGGMRYGSGAGPLAYSCVLDEPCVDGGADPDARLDASAIDSPTIDAPPPGVAHLAAADAVVGASDLVVSVGTVTVDTDGLTIGGLPPGAGLGFAHAAQVPMGPGLAVLRVDELRISAGATLRATGARPLVIVARLVTIDGVLSVAAQGGARGAGGGAPFVGTGRGQPGAISGLTHEGGGGGAGFGAAGGRGGDDGDTPGATGGAGGLGYGTGDLIVLEGGSGGGGASTGALCTGAATTAGAGGGALQVSAVEAITVGAAGQIVAGGGGGGGGRMCSLGDEAGRGAGSGGAIYLQAAVVDNRGVIAANGGGGGGGSLGSTQAGQAGADGRATTSAAPGGTTGAIVTGGGGGSLAAAAGPGRATGGGDGGGGGGAVGHIAMRGPVVVVGVTSPAARTLAP